jgi:hypothetical protein
MIKLKDSPRFKEDYKKYQSEISSVSDPVLKAELTKLLLEFNSCVSSIDQQHTQLFLNSKIPEDISVSRSKLSQCKKNLDTKIQNWKRSNNS